MRLVYFLLGVLTGMIFLSLASLPVQAAEGLDGTCRDSQTMLTAAKEAYSEKALFMGVTQGEGNGDVLALYVNHDTGDWIVVLYLVEANTGCVMSHGTDVMLAGAQNPPTNQSEQEM